MKNIAVMIFVLLIVAVWGLFLVSFQVREIESALVTRFGKPIRGEITEPGFYFKWPSPIEQVYKFDSRMNVLEADLGETTTKGAVPIIINTYIVWKIDNPLQFFNANAHGTVREARDKLLSQLESAQNTVVGRYNFSDFVNSDESKIKIEQIQEEMLSELQGEVSKAGYGIEIKTLGIKQLKISEEVSKEVFTRMQAERGSMTAATITEGKAQATKIETQANKQKNILLAAAEARAKEIRGLGDAEAAQYYKMLDADPEFAMFLRDIEALQKILEARSTIVLSADTMPFKLLKEMPDLTPKK